MDRRRQPRAARQPAAPGGDVWINTHHVRQVETPFGGWKQSGIGREIGLAGLRECIADQRIAFDASPGLHSGRGGCSRHRRASRTYAQAVVTAQQIVIAADVMVDSPDFGHLEPMINAAQSELAEVGITTVPEVVLADAGYWHQVQMEALVGRGMQVLIPRTPASARAPAPAGTAASTRSCAASWRPTTAAAFCAKRRGMIESVFADTKFNRRCERFQRRGRSAARSERRLIAATRDLLRLWRHSTTPMPA